MSPAPPLGSWWTDHLQLPGYDPISTAGPARFDPRAAEQALGFSRSSSPPLVPLGGGHRPQPLGLAPGGWPAAVCHGLRRALPPGRPGPLVRHPRPAATVHSAPTPGTTGHRHVCPGHPGREDLRTRRGGHRTDARVDGCPPTRSRAPECCCAGRAVHPSPWRWQPAMPSLQAQENEAVTSGKVAHSFGHTAVYGLRS